MKEEGSSGTLYAPTSNSVVPEHFQDLIVRVAGYSDYFVNIGKDLQNEIIARTEQRHF
jgi:pyruvate-formate lyase